MLFTIAVANVKENPSNAEKVVIISLITDCEVESTTQVFRMRSARSGVWSAGTRRDGRTY